MKRVTASIDGSAMSTGICEAAAWAALKVQAPVQVVHAIEKQPTPVLEDFSGSLGVDAREQLLKDLVEAEQHRAKLAMEHGKHMLAAAKAHLEDQGLAEVTTLQRHGNLIETLTDLEKDTRLFVIGRAGEGHDVATNVIGSHVETVVRAIHTPILVSVGQFKKPDSFMIAYDGSATANAAIQKLSESPIWHDLPGHLVMVGTENDVNKMTLNQASELLNGAGVQVESHLIQGDIIASLDAFREKHNIGLKVMGAYGHSRIREFFVGSNTSKMIASSTVPLLLLR